MKPDWNGIERRQLLREAAEAVLVNVMQAEPEVHPAEVLMHELLVHKVELEMQNEELRRAHDALEEARDRYVDLYEFAPVCYITVSREGMVSEINMTGADVLGIPRTKLINARFSSLVAPQHRDRWHRLFMSTMEQAEEGRSVFELDMMRADKSVFPAQINALRIQPPGAAPLVRLALVDISTSRQAETELRIAAIAFKSQYGMMITDASGIILRVNAAFCRTTGYSAEELIGQNPRMFHSGRHDAKFYAAMWAGITSSGSWEGEVWNRRKSGDIQPAYLTINAVKDVDGIITHYIASYLRHPEPPLVDTAGPTLTEPVRAVTG